MIELPQLTCLEIQSLRHGFELRLLAMRYYKALNDHRKFFGDGNTYSNTDAAYRVIAHFSKHIAVSRTSLDRWVKVYTHSHPEYSDAPLVIGTIAPKMKTVWMPMRKVVADYHALKHGNSYYYRPSEILAETACYYGQFLDRAWRHRRFTDYPLEKHQFFEQTQKLIDGGGS